MPDRASVEALLQGEADINDAYVDIRPAHSGVESTGFSAMVQRMYGRWADQRGFHVDIVERRTAQIAGIEHAVLLIKGHNAYGWLKTDSGWHGMLRVSPFDTRGMRETSGALVHVYPQIADDGAVALAEADCRVEDCPATEAGRRQGEADEAGIRITHGPTELAGTCNVGATRDEKIAHARTMLRSRLYELDLKAREPERAPAQAGAFGVVRRYVPDKDIVRDTRTGHLSRAPLDVLDGNIDAFLVAATRFYSGGMP